MKSLKELQSKNIKLVKIFGPDEENMFKELGSDPYTAFHKLGSLNYFDFLFLPNKIIDILQEAEYEAVNGRNQ